MKTKIDNEREFAEVIDQLGEAQYAVEQLRNQATVLKQMLETYANENGVVKHMTDRFVLKMSKQKPGLRVKKDLKEADVIAELLRNEVGKTYVIDTYDTEALKRDFARSAEGRCQLEDWGFYLTKSVPHAEVTPR